MFGSDLMGKLSEMQKLADESKKKLDTIILEGEAGSGLVVISVTGNRNIKSVKINSDIQLMEVEDLEDLIAVALQRAMDKANALNENEVMNSAKNFFPGM